MGLLAAAVERRGIATVSIALVREVALRVGAPRALAVPFPFGRPLGGPGDVDRQRAVVEAALNLIRHPGPGPVLEDFPLSPADAAGPSSRDGS
ncbi:MAG: hypothetical protein SFV24_20205 [Gemmatimonadales bacterium]|nr:hypothetical protein [Gemmatimonadales bacterium]